MTHFANADEREVFEAIKLLKDDNVVYSSDLQAIRLNLARLMERIMQVEWHFLEPEIGDLALNLIRNTERGNNVRGLETRTETVIMQSQENISYLGAKGSGNPCRCTGK